MKGKERYRRQFQSPALAVFHACVCDYKYNRGLYKLITQFDKYMTDAIFELEDIKKVAPGNEEYKQQ